MVANLFNRYLWLAQVIYSAGRITREEIDRKWAKSSLNDNHESTIPERTFHRWRIGVEELLHVNIECNRSTCTYYIANYEDIEKDKVQRWILNTFAVTNTVTENRQLSDRILVEDMPSDARFLSTIMEAMRENRLIRMTYQRFDASEPHSFEVEPYCLKAFKQRWYMVGRAEDHPDQLRVYALDRVHEVIKVMDKKFTIDPKFNAKQYFRNYFGVWTDERVKPQQVVIKVSSRDANYIRSLPLHHSQQEKLKIADSFDENGKNLQDGYSIFEYNIAPTFDFIQELRTHGNQLQVLAPQSLAKEMRQNAEDIVNMYS